jgi:putative oxidoreductase
MIAKLDRWMTPERAALGRDIGLLVLRLGVGLLMAFSHGLGKLQKLFAGGEIKFPDPMGIGSWASLLLAGGTEFVASLCLAIGLMTRLVTIPLAFTMLIAVFVIHLDDPFGKKEFGLLYLIPYITLFFAGPGRFSVDELLKRRLNRS